MKRLIVNADDYGITRGVSAGIRFAHMNGLVTTTTAFMNSSDILIDLSILKNECPELAIGVHLNITHGRPVNNPPLVSSMVDSSGHFMRRAWLLKNLKSLDPRQVEAEWRAQIERFLGTGTVLDHIDSHHHISYQNGQLFEIMLSLAREYDLPIRHPPDHSSDVGVQRLLEAERVKSPDRTITDFFGNGATVKTLKSIICNLPNATFELMCHPGYSDQDLSRETKYNDAREGELHALTNPEVRKLLDELGVSLCTFQDI